MVVVADTKGEANDVKVQRKAKWANMDNWKT